MRMDNSWSRDLAMSASANLETGMTYALFHGCDEQDVKVLTDWLKITARSDVHPMLLPALFAELQLRRHKRLTRDKWSKLVMLYAHTGQYRNSASGPPPGSVYGDEIDYDNITRELLGVHQATGFLEKSLLSFQRQLEQMLAQLAVIELTIPQARKDFIIAETSRIGERLKEILDDYAELLTECKMTKDGVSLLIGAVRWSSCLLNPHPKLVSDSLYRFLISLHNETTSLISQLPPTRGNSLPQPEEIVLP